MPDDVDLTRLGVGQDCLHERPHLQHVLFGVVVFGGGVGVGRTPRRRVELGFLVALSAEVGGELPEAGLP